MIQDRQYDKRAEVSTHVGSNASTSSTVNLFSSLRDSFDAVRVDLATLLLIAILPREVAVCNCVCRHDFLRSIGLDCILPVVHAIIS